MQTREEMQDLLDLVLMNRNHKKPVPKKEKVPIIDLSFDFLISIFVHIREKFEVGTHWSIAIFENDKYRKFGEERK